MKRATLLAALLGLAGCASVNRVPPSRGSDRIEAGSVRDAILRAKAGPLEVGETVLAEFRPEDSRVRLSEGDWGYFHVFDLIVPKREELNLKIEPICQCLGFQKDMPAPLVMILNRRTERWVFQYDWFQLSKNPEAVLPVRFSPGEYRILVATRKSREGQSVSETMGYAMGTSISTSVRSSLTGKYRLQFY